MKKLITLSFLCFAMTACRTNQGDTGRMDRFIDGLMQKMTLEEKLGQLNLPNAGDIVTGEARSSNVGEQIRAGRVGGLFNVMGVGEIREIQRIAVEESRLGIPLLFGMDVIHGYKTIFPIPLALASTWDMAAVEQSARIAAIEASADGICWTFSPMVDLSRDPRWGRVAEGSGEDPYLGGRIAEAMVRGYQGDGQERYASDSNIMACVKHYALYGAAEGGRDYNTTDMSRTRMMNEYMYPYRAAVEAGVGSVMTSFNEVDGIPVTANKWLLTNVLRCQWRFDGFVVTDYTAISEMTEHGIGDLQTVSARALDAGVDMDMVSEGFIGTLASSLKERRIKQSQIDGACRRILEAKYKLGLFENPYKYCDPERAKTEIHTQEHRNAARHIAGESFVLLKNEEQLLPLERQGTIAVVGPLADTRSNMVGTWSVAAALDTPLTVVEGIREVAGDRVNVLYAKGSNLSADTAYEANATMFGRGMGRDLRSDAQLLSEAIASARNADVVVAVVGEASEMSGESSSRSELDVPDVQKALVRELIGTGKPVVMVLFTGRPLTLAWEDEYVPAILNVWFGGSESAVAIADVLFGDVNPSGKLTMSFPRNVGQIPVYYNHKNTGRPLKEDKGFVKFRSNYLDVANSPLYPFGYGLSYTTFEYSNITLSASELSADGQITASVAVGNTGERNGDEIVQLYIRDLVGSSTRPVKELKGFERISLKAGETRTVSFPITVDMLKFYDYDLNYIAEPGEFEVMIGTNSRDLHSARFTLK